MLTTKPTTGMIREWKNIYENYHDKLSPNRKTGEELKEYFCTKYQPEILDLPDFIDVVKDNIMLNEANKEKLPQGKLPQIATYALNNKKILVAIDLVTGFYQVEGEDMKAVAAIYDDLFVFRGLDEKDLQNYFLVAQYVICKAGGEAYVQRLSKKKTTTFRG